jgi:hypothetical protein
MAQYYRLDVTLDAKSFAVGALSNYQLDVTLDAESLAVGVLSTKRVEVSLPQVGPQGPQGETGATGPANELTIGSVTTGAPGTQADATLTGEAPNQTLNLAIPRGDQGEVGPPGETGNQGPAGPANTLAIGTVTTGAAGSSADATISGTPPNQTLDLVLPRGDTGAQGNPGPTGAGGVGVVPAPIYATMQEAVEDGITFGGVFRHTSGSVYWVEEPDPDAATFIAASGATDVWNIQQFVKGVKDLGLWNNMVCWPMRSTQNAGTGTTVYSIGGFGAYSGTLVNGPAWGGSGFVSQITANVSASVDIPITSDRTLMMFLENSLTQSGGTGVTSIFGNPASGAIAVSGGLLWNPRNTLNSSVPANITFTNKAQITAALNSSGASMYLNGNAPATRAFSLTNQTNINILFGAFALNNVTGSVTFATNILFNVELTQTQINSMRALWNASLGAGLAYPA